jgi:hypothetical protein
LKRQLLDHSKCSHCACDDAVSAVVAVIAVAAVVDVVADPCQRLSQTKTFKILFLFRK